ncbi:MAG: hypothetical protein JSW39_11735 [Desulfobacterales bacterium]|nr:MAG: hypothetical protein JSW39_11735 [Desulfobacterales bacterium]
MKFLVDYVDNFQKAFSASGFLYFPCYPKSVPDMERLLKDDPQGHPPAKYQVLGDVAEWTTNIGHPGYANAAMAEIFDTGVISKMFFNVATGFASTVEHTVAKAEQDCKRIFTKWKDKGLV